MGDLPVEFGFHKAAAASELAFFSGGSRVLGIDSVGGPPYSDFAEEGGARVKLPGCSQTGCAVTLASVVLDLVGELGDQLGSLCQVTPPNGISMERWWNARER